VRSRDRSTPLGGVVVGTSGEQLMNSLVGDSEDQPDVPHRETLAGD
jgi:hypothetical protein